MTDIVRVKGPDGAEFYTTERGAKATGATIVDKPTHDAYGRLIPIKPNIHKGGSLPQDQGPTVPAKSATRPELEAYAVEHAGMTVEDAAAFANKDDLHTALVEAAADHSQEG